MHGLRSEEVRTQGNGRELGQAAVDAPQLVGAVDGAPAPVDDVGPAMNGIRPPTPTNSQMSDTDASERTRPTGRPFPKGVSGNPGGKPKGLSELREFLGKHERWAWSRLLRLLRSEDEGTSLKALTLFMAYKYGKHTQQVELNAKVEAPRPLAPLTQRVDAVLAVLAEIGAVPQLLAPPSPTTDEALPPKLVQ